MILQSIWWLWGLRAPRQWEQGVQRWQEWVRKAHQVCDGCEERDEEKVKEQAGIMAQLVQP